MCLKGFMFSGKRIKSSIKINLKKFRKKCIFRREASEREEDEIIDFQSRDHRFDLNCNLESCELHLQRNAYFDFCELFFTKPIQRDYFYRDCTNKSKPDDQSNLNESNENNENNESNDKEACKNCSSLPNQLTDQNCKCLINKVF